MSINSLHKFLREGNPVTSATLLSKQFNVPLSSTVRLMKDYCYVYTGEGWNPPSKPSLNSLLSISEETFTKFQSSAERYAKEEIDYSASLKDALQKAIETGNYKNATVICFSLYVLANQPLPLVL